MDSLTDAGLANSAGTRYLQAISSASKMAVDKESGPCAEGTVEED
jgi:hypothetical protein